MQNKTPSLGLEIGLLAVAILAAAFLYWSHTQQPYSAPQGTVGRLMEAANSGKLDELQKASTPDYYGVFVRHFGQQKYQRVSSIYDLVVRLGMPRWQDYRLRASQQAMVAYERLQEQVRTLGREAFNRLPVEERMQLMDDTSRYSAFLFEKGFEALPPDERARIDSAEDFRQGRDRGRFAEREAWNFLSEEDRAALGSPATLSEGSTPEKLAFLDRIGLPLLNPSMKQEIAGIERSELNDPATFQFKYGEPLAREYLAKAKIPKPPQISPCSFPREDTRGSLLREDLAECQLKVQARKQVQEVRVALRKADFRWLVQSMQPNLYEIAW